MPEPDGMNSTADPLATEKVPGLSQAHRGYVYQDVATAYFLARAVFDEADRITVDKKLYKKDLFDDLTVLANGKTVRRQFKSSEDSTKAFADESIRTKTSDLRIDDIVFCFNEAGKDPADEYRICTTWGEPADDEVKKLLVPCNAEPSFEGYPTKLYHLNLNELWPEKGQLKWNLREPKPFTRLELAALCERLTIELGCPQISLEISKPGPLQVLLREFLGNRIGIGRYPNQDTRPEDSAMRLTYRALLARASQETLTPAEIVADLGLRIDFGRVAQAFPVVLEHFVSRREALNRIREQVNAYNLVSVIGSPGTGKSWILTSLADECKGAGYLVVRHYCYLEPSDPFRERRITTDVLFGNLIADLVDSEPSIRRTQVPRFSAGRSELQALLAAAHERDPNRRILLIVDGLDHISRVLAESRTVSAATTSIVEEVAGLSLPPNTCLLLGSQPGQHLKSLEQLMHSCPLTGLAKEELRELAERLGLLPLIQVAFGTDYVGAFCEALFERSAGNPLYATYLCIAAKAQLVSTYSTGPVDILTNAPPYDDNLNNYYRHLTGSSMPNMLACVLALLEFAVSERDIAQLIPEIAPHLKEQMTSLLPVLTEVTGQGGLRVYHESFRRFIFEALNDYPEYKKTVLCKISDWLADKGYPFDSRSYRYLLRYLLRQERYADILTLVPSNFVSSSIELGFCEEAIVESLGLAAEAAAEIENLPMLCRFAELRKSVDTCFREKLDFKAYAKAFLAVRGAGSLATSLLFEGRPVRMRDDGLIACSLCDDAGAVPPWREYLALKGSHALRDREEAAIAEFHGSARTSTFEDTYRKLVAYLTNQAANPPSSYLRGILGRFADVHGMRALESLGEVTGLPTKVAYQIQLCFAEWSKKNCLSSTDIIRHANAALAFATNAEESLRCLELGASSDRAREPIGDIRSLTIEIAALEHADDERTWQWILAVALTALVDPTTLRTARNSIRIDGWYTAWIRFVIDLFLANAHPHGSPEKETLLLDGLRDLSSETDPFRGAIRTCDLYSIRSQISSIWMKTIDSLSGTATISQAIEYLCQISTSTTTTLQGSPNGPLPVDDLVTLCERLLNRGEIRPFIVTTIQRQLKRVESSLYEVQAGIEMRLAAIHAEDQDEDAQSHWQRACQCLCAYGFHKDITIFELINSLPALITVDRARALPLITDLHTYVESLDDRTNGRETSAALVEWYKTLVFAAPELACTILARSLSQEGGIIAWRLEECLDHLISEINSSRSDLTLSIMFTSPQRVDEHSIECALRLISQRVEQDRERGAAAWRRFCGRLQTIEKGCSGKIIQKVLDFAKRHSLTEFPIAFAREEDASKKAEERRVDDSQDEQLVHVAFPLNVSLFRIGESIKEFDARSISMDQMVNATGFRIVQLALDGRRTDAEWLITTFATNIRSRAKTPSLVMLAEGLQRHDQTTLAAIAYMLAGWFAGSGEFWFTGYSDPQIQYVSNAFQLDRDAAFETLGTVLASEIRTGPGYFFGVTCRIVEIALRVCDTSTGFDCWTEAFEVIRYRLPAWRPVFTLLSRYDATKDSGWTIDNSLALLLLSRVNHPDVARKQAALAGIAEGLQHEPAVFSRGLESALSLDTPSTSVILLLALLTEAEPRPFPVTRDLKETLGSMLTCGNYAFGRLADHLLSRINE